MNFKEDGDSVTQGWKDPITARIWDTSGDKINPTRGEQLDILVYLLAEFIHRGEWILDLGYGSGKVEELIFERIPHSQVIGIDNSEAMAQLALECLSPYANRFIPLYGDLAELSKLQLPVSEIGAVIAIQSLHHLSAQDMQKAYRHIHSFLRPGGIFLLLDRLKVEDEVVFPLFRSVWKRLDGYHGSETAPEEGDSFAIHETTLQEEGDFPVNLETHLAWLRECEFHTTTLHVHGNRGLIAAVK
ncbi:class I SAM-dependent methyltransferase [Alicyclobacillaceae bacterium I2511]|nr:class I SAM-dependent methyltransferase [Alicyclobacillaceae bacterium I2511]